MSDDDAGTSRPGGPDDADRRRGLEQAAERRRRLEEVFGTASDQSADDLDLEADGGPTRRTGRGDTWLREQVPPHHGG